MKRHSAATHVTLMFTASVLFSGMSTTLANAASSANSQSGALFRAHTMGRPKTFTEPIPTPIFAGGGSVPALTLRAWGNLYGVTPGQPDPPYGPLVELLYAASTGGSGQRWFLNQAFDTMSTISSNPT